MLNINNSVRIESGGSLSPKKLTQSNLSISSFRKFKETLIVNSEIYVNIREVGKGKQGKVYYVEEISTGKKFAIKAYATSINEEYGMYVQNEFNILHKLSHKNVIKAYELIIGSMAVNLKLEFMEGETLKDLIHDTDMQGNTLILIQNIMRYS